MVKIIGCNHCPNTRGCPDGCDWLAGRTGGKMMKRDEAEYRDHVDRRVAHVLRDREILAAELLTQPRRSNAAPAGWRGAEGRHLRPSPERRGSTGISAILVALVLLAIIATALAGSCRFGLFGLCPVNDGGDRVWSTERRLT